MKIQRFEDLECWQEARKLVDMVYKGIRNSKPFQSDYRLRDQITGAAVSSMSNIAEATISSAAEVQSQLYVAVDQGYIDQTNQIHQTHENPTLRRFRMLARSPKTG